MTFIIKNVLMLVPNPGFRDLIKERLKLKNYNIIRSTGRSAIALETLSEPNCHCELIICESHLEDCLLTTFLEKLRAKPEFNSTFILLLGTIQEVDEMQKCLVYGINAILPKPFPVEKFEDHLERKLVVFKRLNTNFKASYSNTCAYFYELIGRTKTAIKYHGESLKEVGSPFTHFDIGRLHLKMRNKELALLSFQKAEELQPSVFKVAIEKLITKFDSEEEVLNRIPKEAFLSFVKPITQFTSTFYGVETILKIAIICEDSLERIHAHKLLTKLPFKDVQMYENTISALKVLEDSDVNLVLIWNSLANDTTKNFVESMRANYNSNALKIVSLIKEDDLPKLHTLIDIGVDGYMLVPFTSDKFCQRLQRAMALHALLRTSKKSEVFAKNSFYMFENLKYESGENYAHKALTVNPNDYFCQLLYAMNLQMQSKPEAAKYYDALIKEGGDYKNLAEFFRKENNYLLQESAKLPLNAAPVPSAEQQPQQQAAPPVKEEPKLRKRAPLSKLNLNNFESLADMQTKLFGKTEEEGLVRVVSEGAEEFGISDKDFVQPLGVEKVFVSSDQEHPETNKPLFSWAPLEEINNYDAKEIAQLASQILLMNSRIICMPEDRKESPGLKEYFRSLGKTIAKYNLLDELKLNKIIDNSLKILIIETRVDFQNILKCIELGRMLVKKNVADDLFFRIVHCTDEEYTNTNISKAIKLIHHSMTKFHNECLEGKKNFEDSFPKIIESISNKQTDIELINKAIENDHNSFESFKKVYTALYNSNQTEVLDKFFNSKHVDYIKNRKSRDSLQSFLVAIGDAKHFNNLTLKTFKEDNTCPDNLKSMTFLCLQKQEFERAIVCAEALIAQAKHVEYAYNVLGIAHKKIGQIQKAIDYYLKGIEARPNSYKLHYNLLLAYSSTGETFKAEQIEKKLNKLKVQVGVK